MRVATREERKDLSNNQEERVDNVHEHLMTHLTLSRDQETKVKLKQEALANVKCLSIYFVRKHSKGLVRDLSIMGDSKTSRMIRRNVWELEIDVAR